MNTQCHTSNTSFLAFIHMRNAADDIDTQRQRLIELADKASEIIAKADAENRQMTADEGSIVDSLNAEFEHTQADIAKREKVQAMREKVSLPVSRQAEPPPLPGDPQPSSRTRLIQHARAGVLLPSNCAKPSELLLARSADPWRGGTESFFLSIANGLADPRLLQNASGSEQSGVDGGFAVPPEFFRGILDQSLQQAELAPRCRIFTTSSNNLSIPCPDMQDRGTDIAGLSANWAAELQAQTSQRLKFRQVDIRLHKIFLAAEASGELAQDGLSFQQQLESAMSAAAGYSLDSAIISGTGVGQPLGILNDPSAIAVAPESGQAAGTILLQNIINMFSRLAPASQKRAVWFVSPSVISQLLLMVFPSSGGTTIPVLLGSGSPTNAAAGEFLGTILGRPVVVTEVAKQLGAAGDIVLADLSQFALVMRANARIEMDRSAGFNRDAIQWRLIWRVSGCGMWNRAIEPYSGGASLGWCSYLQART